MVKYVKSGTTRNGKIQEGVVVRYAPDWCSPEEHRYLHVVKENQLNPVTSEPTRWLIETLNGSTVFNTTEVVDEEMIEPTGLTIDDILEFAE